MAVRAAVRCRRDPRAIRSHRGGHGRGLDKSAPAQRRRPLRLGLHRTLLQAVVHDYNGGILASGLFWTLPVDDDLRISRDGRRAILDVEDLEVIDSFTFGSGIGTPASLSYRIEWQATGPFVDRGSDATVPPTDHAAFLARFAVARSTASFESSELAFSFRSNPDVSTDRGYAQMGRERNGVFLL